MTGVPNKEGSVIVDIEPDDIEVEVVDDTPPEDRGRPRRPEGAQPEIPDDDEIASYSESVQKRIKKLRYEYHEERRAKEEEQRQKEAAIREAQRAREEAATLRSTLTSGQTALIGQAKARIAVELENAKRQYKEALEVGDADKIIEAQTAMTKAMTELEKVSAYRPPQTQQQPQRPAQQPAAPQVPKPDPLAESWAQKNPWFQKDGEEELTAYAFGVHAKIAREQKIAVGGQAYYDALDNALRERFPERFADASPKQEPRRQVGNVVAPASRVSGSQPQTVTLTASEVAIAKRLGVPLKVYAAEKLKGQKNG